MKEEKIVYFENPGPENTEETLKLALIRAKNLGIKDIVIASTYGATAKKALEYFDPQEFNLVVVTHMTGFINPGEQQMDKETRDFLIQKGIKVLTCTHALSGVERSLRSFFNFYGPVELMANTLRLFGEGMKVCIEIVLMAADAGLIPIDKDVIAIGGTSFGADTAAVIKPTHTSSFFDLYIREIICKPRKRSDE
ncbi:MAG: pyruvate kinase alpha/beta domain-containing protein [Candidatus Asgardarchaeia archaeon]